MTHFQSFRKFFLYLLKLLFKDYLSWAQDKYYPIICRWISRRTLMNVKYFLNSDCHSIFFQVWLVAYFWRNYFVSGPNLEPMLNAVKKLRMEKDKQKELQTQKAEQRMSIGHADQRIGRLEQQVWCILHSSNGVEN